MPESDVLNREQLNAILARAEGLLAEKKYTDGVVVARDLLPLIPPEITDLRLKTYLLILQTLGGHLSSPQELEARSLAEKVVRRGAECVQDQVRAHLIARILGPADGEEAAVRWRRGRELRELWASEAALQSLGIEGSSKEERREAHTLLCCTSLDDEEITNNLDAVFEEGGEQWIVRACLGSRMAFHKKTVCRYIDQALGTVKENGNIADLLEYRMVVLLRMLQGLPVDREEEDEEMFEFLYENIQGTYVKLQLIAGAARQRAWSEFHLGAFALAFGEEMMAEYHLEIAESMAQVLGEDKLIREIEAFMVAAGLNDDEGEEDVDDDEE